jgi:hypothetical protein
MGRRRQRAGAVRDETDFAGRLAALCGELMLGGVGDPEDLADEQRRGQPEAGERQSSVESCHSERSEESHISVNGREILRYAQDDPLFQNGMSSSAKFLSLGSATAGALERDAPPLSPRSPRSMGALLPPGLPPSICISLAMISVV